MSTKPTIPDLPPDSIHEPQSDDASPSEGLVSVGISQTEDGTAAYPEFARFLQDCHDGKPAIYRATDDSGQVLYNRQALDLDRYRLMQRMEELKYLPVDGEDIFHNYHRGIDACITLLQEPLTLSDSRPLKQQSLSSEGKV